MKSRFLLASVLAIVPIVLLASQGRPVRSVVKPPLQARVAIPTRMNETVPGQVLVRLTAGQATKLAAAGRPSVVPGLPMLDGAKMVSKIGKTTWTLWVLPTGADAAETVKGINASGKGAFAQLVNRVYPLYSPPNDPDYGVLEDDPSLYLTVEGDPVLFTRLWHLIDTNAEAGWSIYPNTWYTALTKPAGPKIAIIDTGCDMSHPDFINAGGTGSDVSQGGQIDWSHSKQFRLGEVDPAGTTEDVQGHGTHVAGLAIAAGNNGGYSGHGVIGFGYNATGWILRVFDDQGTGTDADAAAAIFYAADNGADIINLSIGTDRYSQLFQDAATYAFQKGCLVIAAGNENGNGGGDLGPIYPAACSGVIAVTANGPNFQPATSTYAGYGSYIDIAAPGGDLVYTSVFDAQIQFIWSTAMRTSGTLNQNPVLFPPYSLNYAYLAGTSMACPLVSGASALYYGYNDLHREDGWANVRTARALEKSAYGVMGAPYGGWEYYQGYGCLDVAAFLLDYDSRSAEVGAIEGILYYNTTPVSLVAVKAKKGAGITYSTTTDVDGTFRFEALPPGVYDVTAAPFGAVKTKKVLVLAGSDAIGTDFWCGTFSFDTTPPETAFFEIVGDPTPNSVSVRHWAYDTETGVDSMTFRIGTTVGGNDVMTDTQVFNDSTTVDFTGLSMNVGQTYHLRATYVNGAGLSTVVDREFTIPSPAHAVSGSVTLRNFLATPVGVPVTIVVRSPGSTTAIETHVVNLGAGGSFSFETTLVGTFDIAVKGSHWLRKRLQGVSIGSGGVSGLAFSLINGDAFADNRVNGSDLTAISYAWRTTPGMLKWNPNADLNGDLRINGSDWVIASMNWRLAGDP